MAPENIRDPRTKILQIHPNAGSARPLDTPSRFANAFFNPQLRALPVDPANTAKNDGSVGHGQLGQDVVDKKVTGNSVKDQASFFERCLRTQIL